MTEQAEVLREIRDAIAADDGSAADALNRVDTILDREGVLGPRSERVAARANTDITAWRAWLADPNRKHPDPDGVFSAFVAGRRSAETEDAVAVGHIKLALAEMDRSHYGDPEVPFRMRDLLHG